MIELHQDILTDEILHFYSSKSGKTYTDIKPISNTDLRYVYRVKCDGKYYAAKTGELTNLEEDLPSDHILEKKIYLSISASPACNQHFVCLYDTIEDTELNIGILIIELMDSSIDNTPIQDHELLLFIQSMLEAVVYLHSRGIIHYDIHEGNIFRKKNEFKLGDFGESHFNNSPENIIEDIQMLGTVFTRAIIPGLDKDEDYVPQIEEVTKERLPLPLRTLIYRMIGLPLDGKKVIWPARRCLSYFMAHMK